MLCIKFDNHEDETYYHHIKEDMDWDLTKMYPSLDRLVLIQIHVESPMCRAISKHPSIKSIFLYDSEIEEYNLAVFWEACRELECLEMTRISFKGGSMSVPKDAVFNRLRKLAIKSTRKMSPSEQLDLLFHCPKLETLEWDPHGAISTRIMIDHPIQKDRWPQLDELHISRYPQDTVCASVLDGIRGCFGKIVELEMLNSTFGPQASKALCFHSSTLVKLYLDLDSVASSTIRDVMCSCPTLEILWAPAIDAKDIAEGGPWICQQHCELRTQILIKETEYHLHQMIFESLSTLDRLTILDMGGSSDGGSGDGGSGGGGSGDGVLEFRLDWGLGQLARLQELRIVEFHHGTKSEHKQRLEMKDIVWMIDNWKRLKRIGGCLNRSSEVDVQLKEVLRSHGIAASPPSRRRC
jgi:hypothetical protein